MNFIKSFIELGCFGEADTKFNSQLNIISGHSVLTCDNKYKPFDEITKGRNVTKLSLNEEQSLSLPPDKKYLEYNIGFFPGTVLYITTILNP